MKSTPQAVIPNMEALSRTYQYRKVTKPWLERKRRARINHCLDQLKELMVSTLQSEGENVSKLEKADILELSVDYLRKTLQKQHMAENPVVDADRFRAGFKQAANEVSRVLAFTPKVDVELGKQLMMHLAHRINDLDKVQPLSIHVGQTMYSPPSSPSVCSENQYVMPLTPSSSRSSQTTSPSPRPADYSTSSQQGLLQVASQPAERVYWRPF